MEVVITPDDDWFKNPLDSMPIATDSNTNRYHPDKEVVDWFDNISKTMSVDRLKIF